MVRILMIKTNINRKQIAKFVRFIMNEREFDITIGHIEDMIIDDNFNKTIANFMEKYCIEFDDSEENKLIYMDIFLKYTAMIEQYISNYISQRMPSFLMEIFLTELKKNKNNLDGEVFDLLFTMSDFVKFKEAILDFRNIRDGFITDLNLNACITHLQRIQK